MTTTLKGWAAIAHVEQHGGQLHKYADPIEDAREVTPTEARIIASEDCSLICVKVVDVVAGLVDSRDGDDN